MATTTTTTSKPRKPRKPRKAKATAPAATPTANLGGYLGALQTAAQAVGATATPVPVATTPQCVPCPASWAGCTGLPNGLAIALPNGATVYATAFTKGTGANRMAYAYLYAPGSTTGTNLGTVKVALATIANGGNATQAREATAAPRKQAEPVEAEPTTAPAKPAKATAKPKATTAPKGASRAKGANGKPATGQAATRAA